MHKTYPFAAVLRALGFTPTKERDKSSPGVYGRLNGYTFVTAEDGRVWQRKGTDPLPAPFQENCLLIERD